MSSISMGPRSPELWHNVFMKMAEALAKRSKDPNTQIGCVIVDQKNRIISTGFNGPPSTIDDNEIDWSRPNKYSYICHAEDNALWFGAQARGVDGLRDATVYVTGKPCSRCMLSMARAGIGDVYCADTKINMIDGPEWALTNRIAQLAEIHMYPMGDFNGPTSGQSG